MLCCVVSCIINQAHKERLQTIIKHLLLTFPNCISLSRHTYGSMVCIEIVKLRALEVISFLQFFTSKSTKHLNLQFWNSQNSRSWAGPIVVHNICFRVRHFWDNIRNKVFSGQKSNWCSLWVSPFFYFIPLTLFEPLHFLLKNRCFFLCLQHLLSKWNNSKNGLLKMALVKILNQLKQ